MFGNFLDFYFYFLGILFGGFFWRNFLGGFFGRNFFGGFFWEDFLGGILCLHCWSQLFEYLVFVKILSRFCLKASKEGRKISILRSASASSSHLKINRFVVIGNKKRCEYYSKFVFREKIWWAGIDSISSPLARLERKLNSNSLRTWFHEFQIFKKTNR